MFILNDRIKETTLTEGTGSIILNGPFVGFQSFDSGVGDSNSTYYAIENGSQWEVGIGTYNQSDNSLSRDVVLNSSNNKALVNLSLASVVFGNYPASKAFFLDENGLGTSTDDGYVGIKFPDGTIQTTAATGGGGGPSNNIRAYRVVSSDTTLIVTDDVVLVDTTGGPVTITLPFASGMSGRTISLKFRNGTNPATIVPQGTDQLDSGSGFSFDYVNQSISVISDTNDWFIL